MQRYLCAKIGWLRADEKGAPPDLESFSSPQLHAAQ